MLKAIGHSGHVSYWCPACDSMYSVPAEYWNWNKDVDKPTLSPSVRMTTRPFPEGTGQVECCHYHVREGFIEYCGDCTHSITGQKVELPDLDTKVRVIPAEDGHLSWFRLGDKQ